MPRKKKDGTAPKVRHAHSPRPWKSPEQGRIADAEGRNLAWTGWGRRAGSSMRIEIEAQQANLALMLAAPEILYALRHLAGAAYAVVDEWGNDDLSADTVALLAKFLSEAEAAVGAVDRRL